MPARPLPVLNVRNDLGGHRGAVLGLGRCDARTARRCRRGGRSALPSPRSKLAGEPGGEKAKPTDGERRPDEAGPGVGGLPAERGIVGSALTTVEGPNLLRDEQGGPYRQKQEREQKRSPRRERDRQRSRRGRSEPINPRREREELPSVRPFLRKAFDVLRATFSGPGFKTRQSGCDLNLA